MTSIRATRKRGDRCAERNIGITDLHVHRLRVTLSLSISDVTHFDTLWPVAGCSSISRANPKVEDLSSEPSKVIAIYVLHEADALTAQSA